MTMAVLKKYNQILSNTTTVLKGSIQQLVDKLSKYVVGWSWNSNEQTVLEI